MGKPLSKCVPVDDETAKVALREFFERVMATDGPGEVRRMYESFYRQFHKEYPPNPKDWSDKSADGTLDGDGGLKAKSASNGEI